MHALITLLLPRFTLQNFVGLSESTASIQAKRRQSFLTKLFVLVVSLPIGFTETFERGILPVF